MVVACRRRYREHETGGHTAHRARTRSRRSTRCTHGTRTDSYRAPFIIGGGREKGEPPSLALAPLSTAPDLTAPAPTDRPATNGADARVPRGPRAACCPLPPAPSCSLLLLLCAKRRSSRSILHERKNAMLSSVCVNLLLVCSTNRRRPPAFRRVGRFSTNQRRPLAVAVSLATGSLVFAIPP